MPHKWTPDEDIRLMEGLKSGLTFTQVGQTFTPPRTRCAIAGRARRLREGSAAKIVKKPHPPKKTYSRPEEIYKSYGTPKTLNEWIPGTCVFPIEGTNLFCCAALSGRVYCKDHARISGLKYK